MFSSLWRRASKSNLPARARAPRRRRVRFEHLEQRAMLSVNGDFNGDGFDDLAIGVPGEDIDGIIDAGAVNVVYGSSEGLSWISNQFWHLNSPGVNGHAALNDQFGASLAVGDFNGDGYSDLAIGLPGRSVGGNIAAGAVNVLYGSASGLRATGDQQWTQDSPGINETAEPFDRFGDTLAAGDFNGDGRDDLAIGVTTENVGGVNDAGMVNVLYGSNSGLTNVGDQHWHQNSPGINDSAAESEHFGTALAVGDFNGDGRDDLAIGVPNEIVNGHLAAGLVNVIYGSASGLTSDGDQHWHQNSGGINGTAGAFEQFGSALATGDFNGDGRDDLAIGVPNETVSGSVNAGMIHVIYGSGTGLTGVGDHHWHQNSAEGIFDTAELNDRFGTALAAGDFDGDGYDDLAIGVPFEDLDGIIDVGAVHVLYGRVIGLSSVDKFWHQGSAGISASPEASDRYGSALATGDYDGDGRADLAIGAPHEGIGAISNAGSVLILYAHGLIDPANPSWDQSRLSSADDPEANDQFGAALG